MLLVVLAGCSEQSKNTQIVGNDKDSHGCIGSAGYSWCDVKQKCIRPWEESCQINDTSCTDSNKNTLNLEEARTIAKNSECGDNLLDHAFCNNGTGTYWIDLNITKEGCSPACVIDVVTKNASINWRCTGLIN